ncbi:MULTISPECIES: SepM family pheromone-processing serine protease [Metabacillus]|uniref:endopeptidase La n=1 Tax=Metabacillus litoralis TaxID=152268 RepID=A0A179TA92_9BACI|nr:MULTISPECIES: SepM family pheromone-processing serine protease [Metabacillus]OAS89332.1 degradative enzyme [Metabacillus litoralis]
MRKNNKLTFKRILIILLLLVIIAFIPTPYYLYQPGPIEDLEPKVSVEGGHKDEQGSFNLTTVLSVKAFNPYILVYGLVAPHTDIVKEEDVKGDLTDAEYTKILNFMMKDSKQNALVAGFTEAGEEVDIEYHGIFVRTILPDSPAKKVLKVGDLITSIDGKDMNEAPEFISYIEENKKVGDHATLTIKRGDKELEETVDMIALDDLTDRVGIGIAPEEEFTATVSRKVKINSEDIGGPSAGLMFSLEIYNQLTSEDLTKGYKIAGTGTIDHNGNVGQIGGIKHKVTAANEEGADIFFTPKDLTSIDTNEKDVLAEVKENEYEIEIVPIATIAEAVDYLQGLDVKE